MSTGVNEKVARIANGLELLAVYQRLQPGTGFPHSAFDELVGLPNRRLLHEIEVDAAVNKHIVVAAAATAATVKALGGKAGGETGGETSAVASVMTSSFKVRNERTLRYSRIIFLQGTKEIVENVK